MISSTEIEKENLEAHVELCAERYKALYNTLTHMEKRLDIVEEHVVAIREAINRSTGGINKQTINMLAGITGILLTAILGILIHIATK